MTIATLCKTGDNLVSSSTIYGGTYNQLNVLFPRLGIKTKFIKSNNPEDYRNAIDENTKLIYVESIGNPQFQIPDFEALAEVAHENGIPLVVDKLVLQFKLKKNKTYTNLKINQVPLVLVDIL